LDHAKVKRVVHQRWEGVRGRDKVRLRERERKRNSRSKSKETTAFE
jgi:hypothetical protein